MVVKKYSLMQLAKVFKVPEAVLGRVAQLAFDGKQLFNGEEAVLLRNYVRQFGDPGDHLDPFQEYVNLARLKGLLEARLEVITNRQLRCVRDLDNQVRLQKFLVRSETVPEARKGKPAVKGKLFDFGTLKWAASS